MYKSNFPVFFGLFCFFLFQNAGLFAQNEKRDDPFVPNSHLVRQTSPAYHMEGLNYWTVQVNVDPNGKNIVGDAANEPSLAINALDPKHMVIGWRQFDDVSNNFRQAGYAYSTDGGQHWTFPGVINPGIFRSDPVLDADAKGNIFYNSLTLDTIFHCKVYKNEGVGNWDAGVDAYGGDKQWMAIDKTKGPGKGNIYEIWSFIYTACQGGNFTRSTDDGASYEACTVFDSESHWGTIAVDPEGTIFVSAANGTVARSANAQFEGQTVLWDILPADLGGQPQAFVQNSPNPVGLLGQTWIASNHAENALNGQLYLLCSVNPGNGDPVDVMFNRSTDNGETWDLPMRLNDDDPNAPNWQWMGTMSVAPTGRIDVVWLDTRDNPGTYLSSLYYTHSYDGGLSWMPNQRLSMAFDPWIGWPNQQKMGDYFHMVSDSTGANLAWAGTFTGGQDVYFTRIEALNPSAVQDLAAPTLMLPAAPNPFKEQCTLRYQLKESGVVRLDILDALGQTVRIFDAGMQAPGTHALLWDGTDGSGQRLPTGIYYSRICLDGKVTGIGKLVLMR